MQNACSCKSRAKASALQPLASSSSQAVEIDFWTHVAVAAASGFVENVQSKPIHLQNAAMARARWPGESLGVARPPPLVDRLLRADSICFLLCVCMTLGSTLATLYWLFGG